MKFDTTKPVESSDIAADVSDDEEIEVLSGQLDLLHSALDTLEEKNDNIKERLLELLNIVKVNRDQLDQVESNLSSDTNSSELSSLREQLNQMEACMANVMLPRTTDMSSLREQLNQLEVNVAEATDLGTSIMSSTGDVTSDDSSLTSR